MKKYFFTFFIISLQFSAVQILHAQFDDGLEDITGHWELNLTAGANNFLGDLGGKTGEGGVIKDYTFNTIRPLAGISLTRHFNKWIAAEIGANFTHVVGIDSLITNEGGQERWRYNRNLSFRSNIFEAYAGVIIYPTMFPIREHRLDVYEINKWVPFIGGGIGMLHFNPQAKLDDKWINLQALHLEGQGFSEYPDRQPYKLNSTYIYGNIGIKYYMSNRYAATAGFCFRKTGTDYIDDISTTYIDPALFDKYLSPENATLARQLYARSKQPWKVRPGVEKANSKNNDSYMTFFISLNIRLNNAKAGYFPR